MQVSNFELTKAFTLFDSVWKTADLVQIPSDRNMVEVGDLISLFPNRSNMDIWGIKWSKVPDVAWNRREIVSRYKEISMFTTAYLRFVVTVYDGFPGDAMLFIFNQPNVTPDSGLHARVHVEISKDDSGTIGPMAQNRSSAVEQHLIRGYGDIGGGTGDQALQRMKDITEVRFLGLTKQDKVQVRAQCILLGGFY